MVRSLYTMYWYIKISFLPICGLFRKENIEKYSRRAVSNIRYYTNAMPNMTSKTNIGALYLLSINIQAAGVLQHLQ